MTAFHPPLEDMGFVLERIAGLDRILDLPAYRHTDREIVGLVLSEAAKFASEVLAPLDRAGDLAGAVLAPEGVRTPPGFAEAYARFIEGGWNGLVFPGEWGGQGLPWLVGTAVAEMWNAANLAFYLAPLLTQAGIEALLVHGSPEQKRLYLPKLVSGEWTAAMCLTEPQAGSEVGALRTRAERDGEVYRIRGQKIFITFGDHDLASNIVHFVLARLPGAPAGTKGISLFLVPKFLPTDDGRPGPRNDVRCLKLEHKLGIHASPTCVMSYGEGEGAVGWLVGEENEGMRCMFTMMNNARIAVGIEGLGVAQRAFGKALAYARGRLQGVRDGRRVAIVEHPDVRRMLLTMRARIAAMRALCYVTAAAVDRAYQDPDVEAARAARGRVALLTPIVKAWCTDRACEIASLAIQVHGGMGFIEETGIAQHYRDVRITPIYEGTNGIQAIDLVNRKLAMENGRLPWALFEELRGELAEPKSVLREPLAHALGRLEEVTRRLQDADADTRQAAATPYLRLFGDVLGAFLLARGARAAENDARGAAWPGLARFFVHQLLPSALAEAEAALASPAELDPALLPAG
ncbi:3-methylmercaptopropionyl-CoA dehydrogenase [bacterium HR40]|nr:3-methylmercaptopropionyl-CoA dehydrogenase [bacterium HR40]